MARPDDTTLTLTDRVRAEERLGQTLLRYAGRWVAITDYSVIAAEATLDDLFERISEQQRSKAEIIQVPKHPESAHFY